MKKSKLTPIAGPASIILGIIGIVTGMYLIGGILGVIGLIFGLISYADTNNDIVSRIGVVLSVAAIAWTCVICCLFTILENDIIPLP